jgi:hypothetical protein
MRRIVWVAVGAAGGIVVYRRAQQALVDARERGLVVSAQQVGLSAASALGTARALASGAVADARERGAGTTPPPGTAAARVLRQSKQGE